MSGLPDSLELDKELEYADFPNEDEAEEEKAESKTQVFGNLVAAEQGAHQEEILEPGDETQKFQTFKLSKSPLTYFNSSKDTPPEVPRLEVYVDNLLWKRVPSFFDKKSDDHIYVVRQDRNGNSWIQFGDGNTGRRLPTGLGNILARYNTGAGASGKLKSDTTIKPLENTDLIDEIDLYDKVSGGTDRENADKAKESAPGKIQCLGRIVSLRDYETETLSLAGVIKASASLVLRQGTPTIVVMVLQSEDQGGDEEQAVVQEDIQRILLDYDKCRGMQRFPIEILMASFKYIYVEAVYALDPIYQKDIVEQQIQDALGVYRKDGMQQKGDDSGGGSGTALGTETESGKGLFSVKIQKFGQAEYATTIEGAIQSVEGVIWTEVKALYPLGVTDEPDDLVVPTTSVLNPSVSCDNVSQVLRLYYLHLKLNDIPADSIKKECVT